MGQSDQIKIHLAFNTTHGLILDDLGAGHHFRTPSYLFPGAIPIIDGES